MNRGEIRNKILTHLRENTISPYRWPAAEVNRYLNDGYREMAELTGAITRTETISLLANNCYYTLPSDVLYPLAIQDILREKPIDPVHWIWIDEIDGIWIRTRRTTCDVHAAWGGAELLFYPAPPDDRTMTLYSAIIPSGLALDSTVPEFPEQYHVGLVEYGIYRCLLKDVTSGEDLGRAQRHRSYYLQHLTGLDNWSIQRHPNMRRNIYSERLRTVSGGSRYADSSP